MTEAEQQTHRPPLRHAWLLGAAGLALLLAAVGVQKIWSADFWWQIRNGQWIVENLSVPSQEMYSHTSRGTPLREMRWVYCSVIYLAWTYAGAWLLVLGQAAMVAATWGVLVWPVRGVLRTPAGVLIVGLGLAAGFQRWVVRPELITYLLTAAFLVILARAGTAKWRGVWALPLLQVLWVNGHTTFLLGPVLVCAWLGADTAQRIWSRWRRADGGRPWLDRRLALAAVLVVAACWVNPYGHSGAMYAVQMYVETRGSHVTARTITEMISPLAIPLDSWMWDLIAAAALAVVAGATFVPVRRRVPLARLAVYAMGVYLFVMLQRNTALSAVMLGWVGLRNVADLLEEPAWAAKVRESAWAGAANAALGLVAAAAAWYVATDRYAVRMSLPREFGLGVVEWYQPRGAAAFLLEEKPGGHLYNVMRDGGYFIWRVRDLPVYVDGRTDAYDPSVLEESAAITAESWDTVAARRGFAAAVVPNRGYEPLVRHLLASPDWGLAHLDTLSLVFLRRTPENLPILARREIGPDREWTVPEALAERDKVPAWKRAYGGVGRAPHLMGFADSLALIGAAAEQEALEAALRIEPGLVRARVLLAPIYWTQGRADEAAGLLEGASEEDLAKAIRETARRLLAAGKIAEAVVPLEQVLALRPEDSELRIALADAYFRTSQIEKARQEYTRALQTGGSANEWAKLGVVCEQLGDLGGAMRAYKRSLELDPVQHVVWNMLGGVAGRTGDLSLARRCFEESLRLKPDFGPAQRNLEKLRSLGGG